MTMVQQIRQDFIATLGPQLIEQGRQEGITIAKNQRVAMLMKHFGHRGPKINSHNATSNGPGSSCAHSAGDPYGSHPNRVAFGAVVIALTVT